MSGWEFSRKIQSMPDTTSLYDMPSFKTFAGTAAGRRDLQAALDQMFRSTRVTNPSVPREIRLNPLTRKTQDGFRYISSALFRVCRALAPGLSNVVSNLMGPTRQDTGQREVYSTPAACAIFNQLVDLRFQSVLTKAQIILDEERKVIEGFLGPQTHFLENATFLELVEGTLADSCGAEFAGASLAGRRLFARYLHPETIDTPWGDYQRGYAVCASESGDDSIRAYLMYQHVETGCCCLEVPTGGVYRQRRTGSRFMEQIKRLLVKLATAKPRDLEGDLSELSERKLFHKLDDRNIHLVLARWRRSLKLAGMPADIATSVTGKVVSLSDDGSLPSLSKLEDLTEYDLFMASMGLCHNKGQRIREISERAAFKVFLGDADE